MTIELLAADIVRRLPEMAKDSRTNNETLITNLIRDWLIDCAAEDQKQRDLLDDIEP